MQFPIQTICQYDASAPPVSVADRTHHPSDLAEPNRIIHQTNRSARIAQLVSQLNVAGVGPRSQCRGQPLGNDR